MFDRGGDREEEIDGEACDHKLRAFNEVQQQQKRATVWAQPSITKKQKTTATKKTRRKTKFYRFTIIAQCLPPQRLPPTTKTKPRVATLFYFLFFRPSHLFYNHSKTPTPTRTPKYHYTIENMVSLVRTARGQRNLLRRLLALPLDRNLPRIEKRRDSHNSSHIKKRPKTKTKTKSKEKTNYSRQRTDCTHSFQARSSGIPGGGGSHRVLLSSSS